MKWKYPPRIKMYEALGAVADERITISGNTAKVYSSSGNKYYDVSYDPESLSIMTNDNGSYWQEYLGYPAIAYLLAIRILDYKEEYAKLLKGIKWKDLNQRFKNDFDKTLSHIEESLSATERALLREYVEHIDTQIQKLELTLLGEKVKPPAGY